jgi:hypothetical protein
MPEAIENIQENEIVPNAVTGLLSLEDLVKNHAVGIDKLAVEIRQVKEMYDDSFDNNPTYREHMDKVKEVTKAKNALKMQIAKQPSVAQLEQKLKDMRFDLSEKKKTMSDLLLDYKEQTGALQLELFDGQVLEIVSTAKLVKKGSR